MKTELVYVVTSYGKVMGVYEDAKDAFDAQLLSINKGRLSELIPAPVILSSGLSNSKE